MHIGLPVEAEAVLLIEVDGNDAAVLEKQTSSISHICTRQGAVKIDIARGDQEADRLWLARRAAFAAVEPCGPR